MAGGMQVASALVTAWAEARDRAQSRKPDFPGNLSHSYGDASAIVLGQNLALEPYYERHSQQLLYGSNGNLATATQEGTTAAEKAVL